MNFELARDIDEQLLKLAEKRENIEKKIEQRKSTIVDFSSAHRKSMNRLADTIKKQNAEARERNLRIFRDISYASGRAQDIRNRNAGLTNPNTMSTSSRNLENARANYIRLSEKLLPAYREQQTMTQLGALHKLKLEKEQAEMRRQASLREMERAHQLQCAVEQERRQLVLSLALEERDKLAASAEREILLSQGQTIDRVIQNEFNSFGEEYAAHIRDSASSYAHTSQSQVAKHFSANRLATSQSHTIPSPSSVTRSVAENLAALKKSNEKTQIETSEYLRSPSASEEKTFATSDRNNGHNDSKIMSKSFSLEIGESSSNVASNSQCSPEKGNKSFSSDNFQRAASNPSSPMKRAVSGEENSNNTQFLDRRESSLGDQQEFQSAVDDDNGSSSVHKITKANDSDQNNINVLDMSKENLKSPSASLPPKPPMENLGSLNSVSTDDANFIEDLKAKADMLDNHAGHESSTPRGGIDSSEGTETPRLDGEDKDDDNALFSPAPSMAIQSTTKPAVKNTDSKPDLEESSDLVSVLHNNLHDVDANSHILKNFEPSQVLDVLRKVCKYIESFSEPLAVRKGYGAAVSSTSQAKGASVSLGVGVDRQSRLLHAIFANREHEVATFQIEVACALFLRIILENGEYILPRETLNGVVSSDKISKSHRKLGGARGDMWSAILAHMTEMTTLKRMPQEEFAKIVTSAFVSHFEVSERSRFERKVFKTLQLAIIPKEKENASPLSTPKVSEKLQSFRTDLAPTPPASPHVPLSESSESIGNIMGGKGSSNSDFVGGKRFVSQRALEHEKAQNKPTVRHSNAGIVAMSTGNAVLNRIHKISNFDDDEIDDDDPIEAPPQFRDLSENQVGDNKKTESSEPLNSSDEFDF